MIIWLDANKLDSNVNKTIRMNIGNSVSNKVPIFVNNSIVLCKPVCIFLRRKLDSMLSFVSHVDYVMKSSGTQCGLFSKLRHFVRNKELMLYYNSNVGELFDMES